MNSIGLTEVEGTPEAVARYLQQQDTRTEFGLSREDCDATLELPDDFLRGESLLRLLAPSAGTEKVMPFEDLTNELVKGDSLGSGGSAEVFRATDRSGCLVALKLLKTEVIGSRSEVIREARRVGPIRHTNLARLIRIGTYQGQMALVYELVDSASLADVMNEVFVDECHALEIVASLADALHHVHQQYGLVHRDIKPDNIRLAGLPAEMNWKEAKSLRERGITPKLLDFGLATAKSVNNFHESSRHLLGTPNYMSLEQAKDPRAATHVSDLYSLGVILFELLTGERAFPSIAPKTAITEKHATPYLSPRLRINSIPRDLDTIVKRCTARTKSERFYADTGELAADIRRYMTGRSIQAPPFGMVERIRAWCGREPKFAASMIAILVLCIVLAGLLTLNVNVLQREVTHLTALEEANLFETLIADIAIADEYLRNGGVDSANEICQKWIDELQPRMSDDPTDWQNNLMMFAIGEMCIEVQLHKRNLDGAIYYAERDLQYLQILDRSLNENGNDAKVASLSSKRAGWRLLSSIGSTKSGVVSAMIQVAQIERLRDADASCNQRLAVLNSAAQLAESLSKDDFSSTGSRARIHRKLSVEFELIGDECRAKQFLLDAIRIQEEDLTHLDQYSKCDLVLDHLRLAYLEASTRPRDVSAASCLAIVKRAEIAARQFGFTEVCSEDVFIDGMSVSSAMGRTLHDLAIMFAGQNDIDSTITLLRESERYLERCRECTPCSILYAFVSAELDHFDTNRATPAQSMARTKERLQESVEMLRIDGQYIDPNAVSGLVGADTFLESWKVISRDFQDSLSKLERTPKHERKLYLDIWSNLGGRYTLENYWPL